MTQNLFQFDEATHQYLFGEQKRRVPSVTQILQGVGISPDLSHIRPEILEIARERGVRGHLACQYLLENALDWATVADDIYGYVLACERFINETGFVAEPGMVEHQGVNTINGMSYGFRLDAAGTMHGNIAAILDFKLTAAVHDSWAIQTAAYDLAAYAIDKKVRKRFVLHLGKGGGYNLIPHEDRKDYEVFKWALGVETWKALHGGKGYGDEYPIDVAG
jgi:hypothetical protein